MYYFYLEKWAYSQSHNAKIIFPLYFSYVWWNQLDSSRENIKSHFGPQSFGPSVRFA